MVFEDLHSFDDDEVPPFPQFEFGSLHQLHSLLDIISGSMAGVAICLSGHPFDTIKTRLQMQKGNRLFNCVNEMYQKQGIFSFYKGMASPLVTVPLLNAVVFGSYQLYYKLFNPRSFNSTGNFQFSQGLYAGCFAGIVNSIVVCPVQLMKCQLQMQKENKLYSGPWDCFRKIFQSEGIKGINQGMFATVLREIPSYGGQFAAYELVKMKFQEYNKSEQITVIQSLIAGGIAGWACWIGSYPQDLIQTRLQCQSENPDLRPFHRHQFIPDGGFFMCAQEIWTSDGIRGFWRGFGPCMIRAFLANACGFLAYEESQSFLKEKFQID